MNSISKISDFLKNAHIWFFCAFLITNTLSVRRVLFFHPIENQFNEYTGAYIYLSDIFLILAIGTWMFKLYNKNYILSINNYAKRCLFTFFVKCREIIYGLFKGFFIDSEFRLDSNYSTWNNTKEASRKNISSQYKCSTWNNLENIPKQNVPRGTILLLKNIYQQVIHRYELVFPLVLAIFSFISILWATKADIALFRSLKLLEFVLMYFFIIYAFLPLQKLFHPDTNVQSQYKCSTWNILNYLFLIIIISGFIQALVGITQFFLQHSIGFLWLKESIISPDMPGVAKIIFNGQSYIRAYGLFPHPNILGGFLAMSILSTIAYFQLFHVEQFESWRNKKCSTWNNLNHGETKNVPRGTIWKMFQNVVFHAKQLFIKTKTFLKTKKLMVLFYFFKKCSTWNILINSKKLFLYILLLIQGTALSLTFSKSAILGLFMGFFYLWFVKLFASNKMFHVEHSLVQDVNFCLANGENVPRGTIESECYSQTQAKCSTWNNLDHVKTKNVPRGTFSKTFVACEQGVFSFWNIIQKMFHVEHFVKKFFLLFCIVTVSFYLVSKTDLNVLLLKSLYEREFFLNVSRGTFLDNPWLGIGAGQFVSTLSVLNNIESWQFQPVHNVFLLILNEFGIFVFLGFLFFLIKMFHVEHSVKQAWSNLKNIPDKANELNAYFKAILIAFTFIMLFDHYLWDIQQGQIMLWMVFAMIIFCKKNCICHKKENVS